VHRDQLVHKVLKVKKEWLVRKVQKVCKEFKAYREYKDQLVHREYKVLQALLELKVKKEIRDRKVLLVPQVHQDAMELHQVEVAVVQKALREQQRQLQLEQLKPEAPHPLLILDL
jgi:vacuolar-type H+-ATPase subunit D/Vma8